MLLVSCLNNWQYHQSELHLHQKSRISQCLFFNWLFVLHNSKMFQWYFKYPKSSILCSFCNNWKFYSFIYSCISILSQSSLKLWSQLKRLRQMTGQVIFDTKSMCKTFYLKFYKKFLYPVLKFSKKLTFASSLFKQVRTMKQGKTHNNKRMRGDKIPTIRGSRWKYPFCQTNEEKGARQGPWHKFNS